MLVPTILMHYSLGYDSITMVAGAGAELEHTPLTCLLELMRKVVVL